MMNKLKLAIVSIAAVATATIVTGCAAGSTAGGLGGVLTGATQSGTTVEGKATIASDYSGPRANMAVIRFVDATGGRYNGRRWYTKDAGDAMARKLTSSLLATKRFRMVQRANMADLLNEINFGSSGAVDAGSAASFGRILGAKLIVTASITDYEDAGGSTGGAGAKKGILGGLVGAATKKTYMAVNLEVVDVETSEIVASEQLEATIRDVAGGLGGILGGNAGVVAGGVAGWDNEPRGKALQQVINAAVDFLSVNVPERYYTEPPT